jgi:hypothetical protein
MSKKSPKVESSSIIFVLPSSHSPSHFLSQFLPVTWSPLLGSFSALLVSFVCGVWDAGLLSPLPSTSSQQSLKKKMGCCS